MSYLDRENTYLKTGWNRLESSDGQYTMKERNLSWDYSDANMSHEGSYLTTPEEPSKRTRTGLKGTQKSSRQKLKVSSTQTPFGNKTSVSVDKETQMTPQKANTPLREVMVEKSEGAVIRLVKTGSKKRRKRKFVEYDKARLHPPEPGMTEEEMLRWGPLCKYCHKEHFG